MNVSDYLDNGLILAEPDYEKSMVISEFLKMMKVGTVLEVLRDGIEILDFFKNEGKADDLQNRVLLLNLEIPYIRDVLKKISQENELKKIPVIIFSEKSFEKIAGDYKIEKNFHFLKPMHLLSCSEILRSFQAQRKVVKNPERTLRKDSLSYLL